MLSINDLPEYILEGEIFSFLNSDDLFYSVRGVSPEWAELMRNIWGGKLKDEMINQVKSIDFLYEKEVLTKTYEFKMKYLFNYKNLLTAYNHSTNIFIIINDVINYIEDDHVNNLIRKFCEFLGLDLPLSYIMDSQIEELKLYMLSHSRYEEYRDKMLILMDLEENYKDLESLEIFKLNFSLINKEHLENVCENAKLTYSFLQGLIEYQILKYEVKDIRKNIEDLIRRIQEQTITWPKKKNFFEKAYKLILFTKSISCECRLIVDKFQEMKIRHPLIDYNDEALKMILDLRFNLSKNIVENIDEVIYENILNRRVLLTKKIMILENFCKLYNLAYNKDENTFYVLGNKLTIKEFLWCLKFSSNLEQDRVSFESILKTKEYLDTHFDYDNHIIYTHIDKHHVCRENRGYIDYELEEEMKEIEDKSDEKIKEINNLKDEKERLESQKRKTEEILDMLKKFVNLKESMILNKKKYKNIISLLSKIRSGEIQSCDRFEIIDLINNFEIDENTDNDCLSEIEKNEINNFDNIESLLEEIECGLMKQIEVIFKKECDEDL